MKSIKIKNEITSLELLKEINLFREQEYIYKIENNLKLSKVEKRNGKFTELRHSDLLRIIENEFEEEITERKISLSEYKDKSGKINTMYILDLEQSKQVLLRESKFVRRGVLQYINKLEEKLKETKPTLPTTYKEALIELLAQVEENEKLQLENQELKPKAEYTDKVLSSDDTLSVKEIAQDFGKTANWLNKILNTLGIQYLFIMKKMIETLLE